MSKINDGGPAYPGARHEEFASDEFGAVRAPVNYPGMSLRDWFAGQALPEAVGLIGLPDGDPDDLWNASIAKQCYALADAMLAERSKQP